MADSGAAGDAFRRLSAAAHLPMLLLDRRGGVCDANPAFLRFYGVVLAELRGRQLRELLHPEDAAGLERLCRLQLSRREGAGFQWLDLRWQLSHGGRTTRCSIGVLDGEQGELVLYVDPHRDDAPAQDSRLPYRAMADRSPDALLVVDPDGAIRYANAAAAALFRHGTVGLSGASLEQLMAGADALRARLALCESGGDVQFLECPATRKDGSGFQARVALVPLPGEQVCLLQVQDATEEQRRLQRLAYLTHFDPLSGLPNRALLQDRLQHAVQRAQRSGHSVVLIHLDLDRFKQVNESLGHQAGDQLLREVADRLNRVLRDSDTVARLGGDEFAILIEGGNLLFNGAAVAEKLLAALSEPLFLVDRELYLTASAGVVVFPASAGQGGDLLRCAEIAMYRAKALGRNTYCFYTSDLDRAGVDRLQLEAELRHALDRGEFRLYYQPLVTARGGELVGFEALLRWQHPRRGLVPPDQFIPVLEDTKLIAPVGRWVIEEACRQVRAFEAEGLGRPRVAVNLSAQQFRDSADLPAVVQRALVQADLEPDRLELEITETLLMEHSGGVHRIISELDALGVRISVDDFGTGYSSLAYLKRFPVDTLKIDRSFIRGIPEDRQDAAIAEAIVALAERLELEVVAEAVEHEAQLEFLRRWPRLRVQGYIYAPPLPAAVLIDRLQGSPVLQVGQLA